MRHRISLISASFFLAVVLRSQPAFSENLDDAQNAYDDGEYTDAVALLRTLLAEENPAAQYLYARMLENGDGVEKDVDSALRYYRLAAIQNYPAAKERLAKIQDSPPDDKSVALNWYLSAAKDGDMEAQYDLGYMYESGGWGIDIDEAQAVEWYRKAAALQQDAAQLRLGMMLTEGAGIAQDVAAGIRMIRMSAENGNRVANALVQDVFEAPVNLALDKVAIVKNLRHIFVQDQDEIRARLAKILDSARAAPVNASRDEPARSTEPAQTNRSSTTFKPRTHEGRAPRRSVVSNGAGDGIGKDERQAIRYRAAAEQGSADAQFRLGVLYARGKGVPVDRDEALQWLRRAAEQGHEPSSSYLALFGDDAGAIFPGSTIAVAWLREQAVHWDKNALYHLGYLYETGRGVAKNDVQALKLYHLAATQGQREAAARASLLEGSLGSGIPDAGRAVSLVARHSTGQSSTDWMLVGIVLISAAAAFIVALPKRGIRLHKLSIPFRMPVAPNLRTGVRRNLHEEDLAFIRDLWAQPAPVGEQARQSRPPIPSEAVTIDDPVRQSATKGPSVDAVAPVPDDFVDHAANQSRGTESKPSASTETWRFESDLQNVFDASFSDSNDQHTVHKVSPGDLFSSLTRQQIAVTNIAKSKRALHRISAEQLFPEAISYEKDAPITTDSPQASPISIAPLSIDFKHIHESKVRKTAVVGDTSALAGDAASKIDLAEDENGGKQADAQFGIGLMFARGDGVPKNDLLAAKWYKKAADEGHAEAQFRLGELYAVGRGVKKNNTTALGWIRKAALAGFKPAQELLDRQRHAI